MAEKKRQCGTCRFFIKQDSSGRGTCTHPMRAGVDADLLLLRPSELACRTKWGTSLWHDPADESDPTEPSVPQQPTLPEPIAAQLQYDDEVTSVSIAGSKSSRSSFEDDVVDSGAIASGVASWNDPIQAERLDLLRRSSQDALAGARKRHMEKQSRKRDLVPFADDDESATENRSEVDEKAPAKQPITLSKPTFPPDDFVEEERRSADDASVDDEMVDEGVARERTRSPRMRTILREPKNPKSNEAMRASVPSEMRVTSHNPDNREQWNSVPTLNPGIELPLNTVEDRPAAPPSTLVASAATVANASHQAKTVSQAKELLSENRLRQGRAQRKLMAPLITDEPHHQEPVRSQGVTDRPRITEAPRHESAPLDQIKASLLRGYHPVTGRVSQPIDEPHRIDRSAEHRAEPARENRPTPRPDSPTVHQPSNHAAPSVRRSEPRPRPQGRPDAPMQDRGQYRPEARPRQQTVQQEQRPRQQVVQQNQRPQEQVVQRERRPLLPPQQANTPFVREEIEISPNVARACGTCTSYRPSGVPGRGSCTNAFAGPVQRVVYEKGVACKHTYGSFWLPADERVWLEKPKDFSAPTPRVDAMLARRKRKAATVLPDIEELTS